MLKTSLFALTRKTLTYRVIDIPLVISCLCNLPYDSMVRELKAAIPSIQSNFSRLAIVSRVGEELARMWDQDQLLIIFQGLQIHAKWWEILASKGISIDAKAFQSSDVQLREQCVRGMVPKLLMVLPLSESLDKVIEYCRQFDIEPSYACECYLQYLLVTSSNKEHSHEDLTMTGVGASDWKDYLYDVLNNKLEILPALACLQKMLRQLGQYDYDKVYHVCEWLVASLGNEDISGTSQYLYRSKGPKASFKVWTS